MTTVSYLYILTLSGVVVLFLFLSRAGQNHGVTSGNDASSRGRIRRRASSVAVRPHWNMGHSRPNDSNAADDITPTDPPSNPPPNRRPRPVNTHYWRPRLPTNSREDGHDGQVAAGNTPSAAPAIQDCDEEVTFETSVLVGLRGRPDDVTSNEMRVLEQAFIDSYANAECGDRDIDQVMIVSRQIGNNETSSRRRSLQSSSNNRDFTYIFRTSGRCRGCGRNTRLFAQGVSRILAQDSERGFHRGLQYEYGLESHSVEEEDCPCEAPTENDFLLSFNSTIRGLVADGLLVNVVGVNGDIAELEEVDCGEEIEFETIVSLSFEGDSSTEPSGAELDALALSFVDSYNEGNALNGETCDLLFRQVSEANLTLISITGGNANRNRELQSNRFNYEVSVRGRCNGCQRNTRLFGESQRRELSMHSLDTLPNFMQYGERILQTSACFCPVDNPEERAPTTSEFEIIYDSQVQYLRSEGEITSVSSVAQVTDGAITRAPSLVPTTAPTSTTDEVPPPGRSGSSNGDPHIVTFDGLRYDCQGRGEFVLFKTLDSSSFEVQVRYGGNPDDGRVSVGKAYVIASSDAPTLQISISVDESSGGANLTQLGQCPVLFYVDGILADLNDTSALDDEVFVEMLDRVVVFTWKSGIRLAIQSWISSFFGCAISAIAFVPEDYSANATIVGLLGTPNGNFTDGTYEFNV